MEPAVSLVIYCVIGITFYLIVPAPHPVSTNPKQYYAYYGAHVSLVHCLVALALSTCHSADSVVALKLYLYGWDFCGENNELYYAISMVISAY